jgi:hypothetical protein
MITVHVDARALRAELDRLQRLIGRPRGVLQAAARSVRILLQRHFQERDRPSNRLGGRRTHFWLQIRRATQIAEVTDRRAVISVADPRFAHKVTGGRLTPKNVKWLAIPAVSEAHGLRPKAFEMHAGIGLKFVRGVRAAMLVEADATRIRKTKQGFKSAGDVGGRVIYWLVKSVVQAPDPRALPPRNTIESAALLGAQRYVQAILGKTQSA